MCKSNQPIQPGRIEPNGQTNKGRDLDDPAHMGNKDNGPVEDDET
jgi:hypothetical protein